MRFNAVIGGAEKIPVEKIEDGRFRVGEKEREVSVEVIEEGVYSLIVDGQSYEVAVREDKKGMTVEIGAHAIPVKLEDPFQARSASGKGALEGEAVISSPMPGRVVGLKVEAGQAVKEGDGVVLVEAMKMENELHAPKDGKIKSILVKVGEAVEGGQDLVVIE
ncbi:MAG TPA: biotin/lipoyl-containing protein [bacterium]|nr:biotin/lipoyl-containing protein [bacterium]